MIKNIQILTSYTGLGVYIPGIYLYKYLTRKKVSSRILLLERYYRREKQENLNKTIKAFQDNFKLALKAQIIQKDITEAFDQTKIFDLLENWKKEKVSNFIIFSGFWLPVLVRYLSENTMKKYRIDLVHTNSVISVSWINYIEMLKYDYRHIWLFNLENEKLEYQLPINQNEIIPYNKRENRITIHGGGWSLGTYKKNIPEIEQSGFNLDITLSDWNDIESKKIKNRYFIIDKNWNPWSNSDELTFPVQIELKEDVEVIHNSSGNNHFMFDLLRKNLAIVSKPGGATLIDSLASCTPVIFLEPYGLSEEKNASLWIKKGFGISYENWKEKGFSMYLLMDCYNALVDAKRRIKIYKGL